MKKKIINISIILIISIFMIFLFTNVSYAGSQYMNNLKYEVELNEDGSAYITETWDINISDTNTLFKTFKLDSSKYGNIDDVSVLEVSKGKATELKKTDTYAYHVDKGYYYGLKTNTDTFEIAWGVSIYNILQTKEYIIKYKINNAVKTYNDCSEFYWQFLGVDNGIEVNHVVGIIKLPNTVSNKENLKVWAHGPLNGEIYAKDNETITFKVDYLDTQTMLEARVVTLENVFYKNSNKINQNKLQSIINEETTWADAANKKREMIKKQEQMKELIVKIIIGAILSTGIAIFVFLTSKIIKYIKKLKEVKIEKKLDNIEYYREMPDETATPAEAAFLYYFDKKGAFNSNISKIVSAIILNLSLKKAVSFEKDSKDKIYLSLNKDIDMQILKNEEITLYYLLVEVETHKKDNNNENKIFMKDIEKYAKNHDKQFLSKINSIESKACSVHEMKKNYDSKMKKKTEEWKDKEEEYFVTALMCVFFSFLVIPLFAIIPCIICGILCKKLAKKTRILELTEKGSKEKEEWKALKRYMEDFSMLDEREVPELVLWEKYLVYATAFGIADKVLKQLKVKYPELSDENYLLNNGYTYIYMANRYNFDRIIDSGIQKAYSAGIREQRAREAAARSSYSSRRRPVAVDFLEAAAGGGGRRPEWAEDEI